MLIPEYFERDLYTPALLECLHLKSTTRCYIYMLEQIFCMQASAIFTGLLSQRFIRSVGSMYCGTCTNSSSWFSVDEFDLLAVSIVFCNQCDVRCVIILIMKTNQTHSFSHLYDKVLYMFWASPLSIVSSISTLYARNRYLSC